MRWIVVALLALAAPARAEMWPSLEEYVVDCTLIVKAKTIVEDKRLTFRVLESWRGTYDPKRFDATTKDGRFFASQGEHGVDVVNGQEIVFFFTKHNQPDPKKLSRHSTSFPIKNNKVVYASTSDDMRQEFTVTAFKLAIQRVPKKK